MNLTPPSFFFFIMPLCPVLLFHTAFRLVVGETFVTDDYFSEKVPEGDYFASMASKRLGWKQNKEEQQKEYDIQKKIHNPLPKPNLLHKRRNWWQRDQHSTRNKQTHDTKLLGQNTFQKPQFQERKVENRHKQPKERRENIEQLDAQVSLPPLSPDQLHEKYLQEQMKREKLLQKYAEWNAKQRKIKKRLRSHMEHWRQIPRNDAVTGVPTRNGNMTENTVEITLYYEADCPFCRNLIVQQVSMPFVLNALQDGDITLTMVPYGNAHAWYDCQHGWTECQHNMLEACVIHFTSNAVIHLPIIRCLELEFEKNETIAALKICANEHIGEIMKCYDYGQGNLGIMLINEMAKQTVQHNYVPWVLINGKHSPSAEDNLKAAICEKKPTIAGCPKAHWAPTTTAASKANRCVDDWESLRLE